MPDSDTERDDALKDTFPASDPPATGGTTGPNDGKPSAKPPPQGNDTPLSQGV